MTKIEELKILIREKEFPYFTDEELEYHLSKSNSISHAAYKCLTIKSEDTTLQVSGLSLQDTSKYFRRLASQYRPNNSGTLIGEV